MEIFGFLFACWVCVVLVSWRRFARKRRRGKLSVRTRMTGAAVGNALHMLQEFVQPQVRYVIQEQLQERSEEDEASEPKDPKEHLLKQARRIRRGEEVETITAIWGPYADG